MATSVVIASPENREIIVMRLQVAVKANRSRKTVPNTNFLQSRKYVERKSEITCNSVRIILNDSLQGPTPQDRIYPAINLLSDCPARHRDRSACPGPRTTGHRRDNSAPRILPVPVHHRYCVSKTSAASAMSSFNTDSGNPFFSRHSARTSCSEMSFSSAQQALRNRVHKPADVSSANLPGDDDGAAARQWISRPMGRLQVDRNVVHFGDPSKFLEAIGLPRRMPVLRQWRPGFRKDLQ